MPDLFLRKYWRLPFFAVISFCFSLKSYGQSTYVPNSSNDSVTVDSSLSRDGQVLSEIQKMYFILGRITNAADRGIDTKEMEDKLPDIDSILSIITETMTKQDKRINIRNLQLFQILMQDMISDMRDWQSTLQDYNKELISMEDDVKAIVKDIGKRSSSDSLIKTEYIIQLKAIKERIRVADSTTSISLAKVEKLQGKVADDFLQAIDLRKKVQNAITNFSDKITTAEYPYLWQTDTSEDNLRLAQLALPRESKILKYFFKNSWDERAEMLVVWLLFFIWVLINFLAIRKNEQPLENTEFTIHFLKPLPFLSGIVVVLALAPAFDLHPPAVYVDMLQFWLLVALTILLWHNWPKKLFYPWVAIVVLFFLFSFVPLFMNYLYAQRLWFLALNVVAIIVGIIFYPRISKSWALTWLIKPVIALAVFLNILAILANLYGRVTLSQMLSTASIFGLTQVIALSVFVKIIYESVYLQILKLRIRGGVNVGFEFSAVEKKFMPVLNVLCLVLWLIVFTTNINLYDTIYTAINQFLDKRRIIGSTGYSYGSIVIFFVIIYVANFLQKYIAYLWGSTGNELVPVKKSKIGSRLLFMRVLLLTAGFLLAVAASGLPLDKITIILGALGVGIGLGLQNIVNNLVSGIVLIFERPVEIGDSIEIGDKKGTVKEIGLRSSTLISGSGAEIIIPNGDFLSQHVVNWTLSNSFVRVEIPLFIPVDADIAIASKIITEETSQHPDVMTDRPVSVIVNEIDQSKISLTAYFWCSDIHKVDQLRSDVLKSIRDKMLTQGIKLY
jgi:potassium efflux system protein